MPVRSIDREFHHLCMKIISLPSDSFWLKRTLYFSIKSVFDFDNMYIFYCISFSVQCYFILFIIKIILRHLPEIKP